jgi:type I restriction enzyme, S subunit
MNKIKLGKIAYYSDTRIDLSNLTEKNYVGTDNLLQNKKGKVDSEYLRKKGKVTEYKENDILIANIRPYLRKIWRAKGKGGSSADVLTIRVGDSEFYPNFIYYNLFQDTFFDWVMKGAKGSKMPRGDKNQIMEFQIPKFDYLTQKKIVSVLSVIDDKIELNHKINTELEQLARQIYEYWFLQFDFPDENGNPYKSSGGKMVQSNILKREIPIEWEVKELKDILVNITDKSEKIRSENILNDGIFPVITQDKGEIIKGYTNNKKPIKINPLLIFGDHSCTLKYVDFPFFRGADGTQILNFSNDKLTRYCYFSIQKFLPQIPNFGKYERHFKYLKAMPIVLPSIKVLNNFDGFAKSIFKKIEHNNIEIYNLEKQRDYLLPMLMNGQINVDNIQVN